MKNLKLFTFIIISLLLVSVARQAIASEELPNFIYKSYLSKANSGDTKSMFSLGLLNENRLAPNATIDKALFWYEKAAHHGHLEAALNAGRLFLKDKKLSRAYSMFELAMKGGSVEAIFNLAYMLDTGSGVEKNQKLAFQYYLKAANLGMIDGMRQVALSFWQGYIVERDIDKARMWLLKAISKGDMRSKELLEQLNLNKN